MRKVRRHKFNAKRESVDGIWFDSAAEARRYEGLKKLEAAGQIHDLVLQPTFTCDVNGRHICVYKGDFLYDRADGTRVVEDVKGVSTQVFKMKRKLVEALHGVTITVIPA